MVVGTNALFPGKKIEKNSAEYNISTSKFLGIWLPHGGQTLNPASVTNIEIKVLSRTV
jgi:hypothetical protein